MTKKLLNALFVGAVLLVLLAGLAKTLFFPEEINEYENRYAEQVEPPTLSTVLDGSFQESMDGALSDQVPFSTTCKRLYNSLRSAFRNALLSPILEQTSYFYVTLTDKIQLFGGDYLVYPTYKLEDLKEALSATADSHNRMAAAHPDTEFYFYYIEKDVDMNFETGEPILAYEYLRECLSVPADHIGSFPVPNFNTYREFFYRTDHHWNHAGSYAGYLDLVELLGISEPALEPADTVTVGNFSGSKAAQAGVSNAEPFAAHRFDFPAMTVTVNGQRAEDYGDQASFFNGSAAASLSYGHFYGGDSGEVILDTGTTGRGNLLVIGESHDNAILKLLASHYDRTHSIDLRNYEHDIGAPFDLNTYLEQHGIDAVLFIGSVGFYTSETFRLEG